MVITQWEKRYKLYFQAQGTAFMHDIYIEMLVNMWMIKKNLTEFKSLMYYHYTPEKFEYKWKRVVDSYGLSNNEWVKKTYELKRMWASAYTRDHFLCGVRTTSICEGVNSFIKKYVQHKNNIVDFLHNFERALKDYRRNELFSDFKLFYYHLVLTSVLLRLS
jgi:hypothetical protein